MDWNVCWHFFLIFCVFFRSSLAFINLLGRFFFSRALQFFFIIIKYVSIVTTETWFVCSMMLITMCMVCICIWLAKEHHIGNSNKKPLHDPGYRFANAVKLSLQLSYKTQLRTCIILVIFSCFRNTIDTIVSNQKNPPIFTI